jgi:hypothetical protein
MLEDIRTSPEGREAEVVLSQKRDYVTSSGLLPVLKKHGKRTL